MNRSFGNKLRVTPQSLAAARLSLAVLVWACAAQSAHGQASDVQPGYEFSGSPRAEFLLGDLRGYVGKKYWVRRPLQGQSALALFCDNAAPPPTKDCPREKFGVASAEQFTIEDVAIAKPEPRLSWFKIRLESSKKTAYLNLQDFSQHGYNERRVSAPLLGVDDALANSGWIFDDYPDKVLNNRREQLEKERDAPRLEQERIAKERALRTKLLYIGMSTQQVLNSTWGPPNDISVTMIGWRRMERWDYGGGNYLYFENDRLQRMHVFGR